MWGTGFNCEVKHLLPDSTFNSLQDLRKNKVHSMCSIKYQSKCACPIGAKLEIFLVEVYFVLIG